MQHLHPVELSRVLARAEAARRAWLERLRVEPSAEDRPLELFRPYLMQASFDQISELPEYDPLRGPLLRWMLLLIDARVNQQWFARLEMQRRIQEHPGARSADTARSLAELRRLALRNPERADDAMSAIMSHGGAVAATTAVVYERQREMTLRLRVEEPLSWLDPGMSMVPEAENWLTATDELTQAPEGFGAWLGGALARDVNADWPARLNESTLGHWFRETPLLRDLPLDLGPLPERYGAASFARSLYMLGCGFRRCLAPANQPFVVAQDPGGLAEVEMGALFASLLMTPSFATSVLSVARSNFPNYSRPMALMHLRATRLTAISVLIRNAAWTSPQKAARLASEVLSAEWRCSVPVDSALAALSMRPRPAQQLAGLFTAMQVQAELVEAHDDDWYRNPRAADQLRSEAERPPEANADPRRVSDGAAVLLKQLRTALC